MFVVGTMDVVQWKAAQQMRMRIRKKFERLDAISKKVDGLVVLDSEYPELPVGTNKGEIQRRRTNLKAYRARTQKAIRRLVHTFLLENMLTLGRLPDELGTKEPDLPKRIRGTMSQVDIDENVRVLLEQRNHVKGFIGKARAEGKLDEVKMLMRSLNDLEKELEILGHRL